MKVGIFASVLTHDQQTLSMQIEKMKEFVENQMWKLAAEFQEVTSGTKALPQRELH